eukprot:TRINITY_DN140_c0_g4_i1.p1 TRINITY_DN140_c0_g4~~TRINITY_DN140_c0_g4_i1.p1  ORF type:complete len:607 (+),score=193.04 TRINITY_DN140_c0_g4_i1:105-1823(+)
MGQQYQFKCRQKGMTQEIYVGGGKYILGKKLGGGSFGEIYLGINRHTREFYAVKLESKKTCKHLQLAFEYKIMKQLEGAGIPKTHYYGEEGDYNVLILDLLGPSLEDLFSFCGRRFSLKTALMVADQLLSRVEYIHSKNYIHRDVKPDNFLIGLGKKSNQIFVIDFGLAKKFRDAKTHQHIPYKENKNLTGTARYASINAHLGIEQSRRDDLEAIGYVLVYFVKGKLPWQGVNAQNKGEKYHKIMEKKMATPVEYLCLGIPPEFSSYMHYCRSLRFEDRPDYGYLRKMFKELVVKESLEYDYIFDWTFTEPPKKQAVNFTPTAHAEATNGSGAEPSAPAVAKEGEDKKSGEEPDPKGKEVEKKAMMKSGFSKSNTANFGSELEGEGKEEGKEEIKEKSTKKGKESKDKGKEKDSKDKDADKDKEKDKGKEEKSKDKGKEEKNKDKEKGKDKSKDKEKEKDKDKDKDKDKEKKKDDQEDPGENRESEEEKKDDNEEEGKEEKKKEGKPTLRDAYKNQEHTKGKKKKGRMASKKKGGEAAKKGKKGDKGDGEGGNCQIIQHLYMALSNLSLIHI